jgi:hypothetical protein
MGQKSRSKKVMLHVHVSRELHAAITRRAEQGMRTKQATIELLLRAALASPSEAEPATT